MKDSEYHIPVLLHVATNALINKPDGSYVDVTFGGGGHSKLILENLQNGRLLALDQDEDAFKNSIEDSRFQLVRQNFRNLENVLQALQYGKVDGILADLGVSSHQFDDSKRGFSFRFDSKLDMRMNVDADKSAYHIVNGYEEERLREVFMSFGEFTKKEAARLTSHIISKRDSQNIETTLELRNCIDFLVPEKVRNQFLARVFQAIRIEVNEEMSALIDFLNQIPMCLKPEGVAVIITYHSLEDRLVKNFFKSGNIHGVLDKDFYGVVSKPMNAINKKPIIPDLGEIKANPRARSAKLRIAKMN